MRAPRAARWPEPIFASPALSPAIRLQSSGEALQEIEGAAGDGGYPEDVVDTVKANARDLKLSANNLGFEEK